MPVSRNDLVNQANIVMAEILEREGYFFEPDPPETKIYDIPMLWFIKEDRRRKLVYIIEFQPRGLGGNEIFDLTINLHRREVRDLDLDKSRNMIERKIPLIWAQRIGPLYPHEGNSDHWWHFVSIHELHEVYEDMLIKIIDYGIPFVEDLDVNSMKDRLFGPSSWQGGRDFHR